MSRSHHSSLNESQHSTKKKVAFEKDLRSFHLKDAKPTVSYDPMMEKLQQWKREKEIVMQQLSPIARRTGGIVLGRKRDQPNNENARPFSESLRSYFHKRTNKPAFSTGKTQRANSQAKLVRNTATSSTLSQGKMIGAASPSSSSQRSPFRQSVHQASVTSSSPMPSPMRNGYESISTYLSTLDESQSDIIDLIEDRIEDLYYDFVEGKISDRQTARQEIMTILTLCDIKIVKGLMEGGLKEIKKNQQLWYVFLLNFDFKTQWKNNALTFLKENNIMNEDHFNFISEHIQVIPEESSRSNSRIPNSSPKSKSHIDSQDNLSQVYMNANTSIMHGGSSVLTESIADNSDIRSELTIQIQGTAYEQVSISECRTECGNDIHNREDSNLKNDIDQDNQIIQEENQEYKQPRGTNAFNEINEDQIEESSNISYEQSNNNKQSEQKESCCPIELEVQGEPELKSVTRRLYYDQEEEDENDTNNNLKDFQNQLEIDKQSQCEEGISHQKEEILEEDILVNQIEYPISSESLQQLNDETMKNNSDSLRIREDNLQLLSDDTQGQVDNLLLRELNDEDNNQMQEETIQTAEINETQCIEQPAQQLVIQTEGDKPAANQDEINKIQGTVTQLNEKMGFHFTRQVEDLCEDIQHSQIAFKEQIETNASDNQQMEEESPKNQQNASLIISDLIPEVEFNLPEEEEQQQEQFEESQLESTKTVSENKPTYQINDKVDLTFIIEEQPKLQLIITNDSIQITSEQQNNTKTKEGKIEYNQITESKQEYIQPADNPISPIVPIQCEILQELNQCYPKEESQLTKQEIFESETLQYQEQVSEHEQTNSRIEPGQSEDTVDLVSEKHPLRKLSCLRRSLRIKKAIQKFEERKERNLFQKIILSPKLLNQREGIRRRMRKKIVLGLDLTNVKTDDMYFEGSSYVVTEAMKTRKRDSTSSSGANNTPKIHWTRRSVRICMKYSSQLTKKSSKPSHKY